MLFTCLCSASLVVVENLGSRQLGSLAHVLAGALALLSLLLVGLAQRSTCSVRALQALVDLNGAVATCLRGLGRLEIIGRRVVHFQFDLPALTSAGRVEPRT